MFYKSVCTHMKNTMSPAVFSKSSGSSKEDRRRLLSSSPTQQVDTQPTVNTRSLLDRSVFHTISQ